MMNQYSAMNNKEEFIVIAEEQDRNYWAARLGVSGETLKSAIRACKSTSLVFIKNYLSLKQHPELKSGL
ncbi:MAG: DUF3606 domain-containing protein [Sphingobacteriales bacterium]|nr:MAG: DUF3606 domain-containing protein [Sphingobacteriales bacterium]